MNWVRYVAVLPYTILHRNLARNFKCVQCVRLSNKKSFKKEMLLKIFVLVFDDDDDLNCLMMLLREWWMRWSWSWSKLVAGLTRRGWWGWTEPTGMGS